MRIGKLYKGISGKQFVAKVKYWFQNETPTKWWGELVPMEYVRIIDSGDYEIELQDKRRRRCYLQKRVIWDPTRIWRCYVYHFVGTDSRN